MTLQNQRQIQYLRAIADYLEQHPDAPDVYLIQKQQFQRIWVSAKEELAEAVRGIGSCRKNADNEDFEFIVELPDGQELKYYTRRDLVCTKKVVGTKIIAPVVHEAYVEPERVEEVVEWECGDSVLASASEQK